MLQKNKQLCLGCKIKLVSQGFVNMATLVAKQCYWEARRDQREQNDQFSEGVAESVAQRSIYCSKRSCNFYGYTISIELLLIHIGKYSVLSQEGEGQTTHKELKKWKQMGFVSMTIWQCLSSSIWRWLIAEVHFQQFHSRITSEYLELCSYIRA